MKFKGIKKAEEYSNGRSSSSVFKENHIKDYLRGYNQALEDSKYIEMLEMLKKVYDSINMQNEIEYCSDTYLELEQLIKESTDL